jgi:hypothetical protein
MVYRWFMTVGHPKIREIMMRDLGSSLVYLPSSAADFKTTRSGHTSTSTCVDHTESTPSNE